MSVEYDAYLREHRANVKKGFLWMQKNMPSMITDKYDYEKQITQDHDKSKNEPDEYDAYDRYFYGGNRSYAVTQAFNEAWLKHIHRNPHHWQHWVLVHDEGGEDTLMDMPLNYIIEMICDWWAFSWKSGNLYEIFDWYDDHVSTIRFSYKTKLKVEAILETMKTILDKEKKEKDA